MKKQIVVTVIILFFIVAVIEHYVKNIDTKDKPKIITNGSPVDFIISNLEAKRVEDSIYKALADRSYRAKINRQNSWIQGYYIGPADDTMRAIMDPHDFTNVEIFVNNTAANHTDFIAFDINETIKYEFIDWKRFHFRDPTLEKELRSKLHD